jgi:hypothetical protein
MRLGDSLEMAHEKVVQTLAGRIFVYREGFGLRGLWVRFGPYNVFH